MKPQDEGWPSEEQIAEALEWVDSCLAQFNPPIDPRTLDDGAKQAVSLAAEFKRLRAEKEAAENDLAAAKAEIERLRKALVSAVPIMEHYDAKSELAVMGVRVVINMMREALGKM